MRSVSASAFVVWACLAPIARSGHANGPEARHAAGMLQGAARTETVRKAADEAWSDAQRLRAEWWVADYAERARKQYEAAATLSSEIGDKAGEARAFHGLCALSLSQGEYQSALELCGRALTLSRTAANREREAGVLLSLSTLHERSGDPSATRTMAGDALRLFRAVQDRSGEGGALVRIGQSLLTQRDLQSARGHFAQALDLFRTLNDPSGESLTLTLLGQVDEAQGDHEAAIGRHRAALAVAEAAGDLQRQGVVLDNLGASYTVRGDHRQAVAAYERAIGIFRSRGDRRRQAAPLFHLAGVERRLGHLESARAHIEAAIEITEWIRRSVSVDELRASTQASRLGYYGLYIDILMRQHRADPAAGHDRRAFEVSEHARARSLLDLLAEGRVDILRDLPPALKAREKEIEARLSRAQHRLIAARAGGARADQLAALQHDLDAAEQSRRELEWEVRGRHREYAAIAYPAPLTFERAAALLDRRTALLEYVMDPAGSFLFVVTTDGLRSYRLADAEVIDRLVMEARQALARPGRREFTQYRRAAERLYQTLLAPAADVLNARDGIVVVPHGSLHYLPFEALLTEASNRAADDPGALPYLLKRWSVSYVPSSSVLASLHDRAASGGPGPATPDEPDRRRRRRLVAIAKRSFAGPIGSPLGIDPRTPKPLLHASREIEAVARGFTPADVVTYLDQEASEDRIKRSVSVEGARYVHVVTHAVLNELQPAHAGLVLSAAARSNDDGVLRVYEIYNMRLRADLVVLSACDTGRGRALRGEGVMGLSRAFLYAGASSLVVSLWQVADPSTPDLMAALYAELPRARKVEALRRAKLAMIAGGTWAHPHHWAPFVLQGATQ